jgi:hypothetical protein
LDSPCIDAADNAALPADRTDLDDDGDTSELLPIDLAGGPRFVDDLLTPDTGEGTPPIVDMGAYERIASGDQCLAPFESSLGVNVGTNIGFGPDDREAACHTDSNNDAWFEYIAPCVGTHLFSLEGTTFEPTNDTVLSIYDACDGEELACDDDSGDGYLSELLLDTDANTTYHIRVAGAGESVGEIVLNIATVGRCLYPREPERIESDLRRRVRPKDRTRR